MDFAKLLKKQKESRENDYILPEEIAQEQIIKFVSFYEIDLTFDIESIVDEALSTEIKAELSNMTPDEKKGAVGIKQIVADVAHWIRRGVLSFEMDDDGTELIIKHTLLSPIGLKSENSQPITNIVYKSVRPKHTERMSAIKEDKMTFAQKSEFLMSLLSGIHINIINKMDKLDKRAIRAVGMLLLTAL